MAPTFQFFSVIGEELTSPQWTVDFLLPNGIMITLLTDKEASLSAIKEQLWRKTQEYPLHAKLKGKMSYFFSCINQMAERVLLEDESIRLCDAGLFQPILKVEEKKRNNEENNLKAQISMLIGKGVHEFDAMQSVEVSNFREDKKKMCERLARERDGQGWNQRVICLYPPNINSDTEFPKYLNYRLKEEGRIQVKVSPVNATASYTINIIYDADPDMLIKMFLRKLANTGASVQSPDSYCLKVVGREEYLLGDYLLYQYNYIRVALSSDLVPHLIAVPRNTILEGDPPSLPPKSTTAPSTPIHGLPNPPMPPRRGSSAKQRRGTSLWDMDSNERFEITLQGVANVNLPDYSKIQIRAGVYHGLEVVGDISNSSERMLKDGYCEWNQTLVFDLPLQDLPRMARLCFLLYVQNDKRKEKKEKTTIGGRVFKQGRSEIRTISWVNIPVFDWQGILHTGSQTLYMWSLTGDDCLFDTALNPIGTVECNPDADEAVQLKFEFSKYNIDGPLVFPSTETVLQVAAENTTEIVPLQNMSRMMKTISLNERSQINSTLFTADERQIQNLRQFIDKDPLIELGDQDKEMIWKLRLECHEYFPDSLPKVLSCVQWDNHINVALMQALLQIWRPLGPDVALELLDFRYPDKEVRRFAVKCIRQFSDGDLIQHLLQLVQVLKYEPYLDCDLVNFLLEKALNNQHIGHYLFWLLRSEMYVPSVSVRFGLILEAYCHGNKNHLKTLSRQTEALKKLRLINESIKHMSNVEKFPKNQVLQEMRKLLSRNLFLDSLSSINCFLDPARILKEPIVEQCRVMDSKMKPMWMVWSNNDNFGEMAAILYKKGDDLRQDMLTLQILRIMDSIWKKEGFDFRLNAYQCLPTGQNEGMIGIVTESTTIATIQKKYTDSKLKSAFNPKCLYSWLKEKHPNPADLEKALEEFTLSCAGYCVATYVLGIGDRHSDNILLRENGQLVHIDFGHILGHFKSKMGFKRERVPFVLTADFVYVIQRGPAKSHDHLIRFKQICEQAYMALRSQSHFLITLFMMMMNTGIPELSSLRDVEFLREQTLVPHLTDSDARQHWRNKYSEALKNSFWSSVNFAFHNAARDNK